MAAPSPDRGQAFDARGAPDGVAWLLESRLGRRLLYAPLAGRHALRPAQRHPVPVGPPAGADQREGTRAISTRSGPSAATGSRRLRSVHPGRPRPPTSGGRATADVGRGRPAASVDRHLDPWQQARLALLNMALADGYIAVLAEKYDYLFWRPVTAIRVRPTRWQPGDDGRSDLDAARDHTGHPRPPVRPLHRGRRGRRGLSGVLRYRPHALRRVQPVLAHRDWQL